MILFGTEANWILFGLTAEWGFSTKGGLDILSVGSMDAVGAMRETAGENLIVKAGINLHWL